MTILPKPTNSDRAAWAEEALLAFCRLTGSDYEDAMCDLLCDLMHWADESHLAFDGMLSRAREHYAFEAIQAGEVPL